MTQPWKSRWGWINSGIQTYTAVHMYRNTHTENKHLTNKDSDGSSTRQTALITNQHNELMSRHAQRRLSTHWQFHLAHTPTHTCAGTPTSMYFNNNWISIQLFLVFWEKVKCLCVSRLFYVMQARWRDKCPNNREQSRGEQQKIKWEVGGQLWMLFVYYNQSSISSFLLVPIVGVTQIKHESGNKWSA